MKADKMFEKLGYVCDKSEENCICYIKTNYEEFIIYNELHPDEYRYETKVEKQYIAFKTDRKVLDLTLSGHITAKEIKAISKKIKEMRW